MKVNRTVRGDRFGCAGGAVCRQNCAANRAEPSRRWPARSTAARCKPGASNATDELDPLDRPDPGDPGIKLPNQAQSIVEGNEQQLVTVLERDDKKEGGDVDYLQVSVAVHACTCHSSAWFADHQAQVCSAILTGAGVVPWANHVIEQ